MDTFLVLQKLPKKIYRVFTWILFSCICRRNVTCLPCGQVLETESLAKAQEVESLRLRINTEEDRHTVARQEAAKLKSKVDTNI